MQVFVRDNNVDQALKVLKKKLQREGSFRELKRKKTSEKPSEKKARKRPRRSVGRASMARKNAQREGLLPMPVRKVPARGIAGRR